MDEKEEIHKLIKEVQEANLLVVVEGPRDRNALENLGIKNIMMLSKKPLYACVEEIAEEHAEVVLLTDFDKKGKELYAKLSRGLQGKGVKINNNLRLALFRAKLSHVEGLDTFLSS